MKAIKSFATLASVALIAAIVGCGGGGQSVAEPALEKGGPPPSAAVNFVVRYSPSSEPLAPTGVIEVSPPAGPPTIGAEPIAQVELLLFGYDSQVLTIPNGQSQDDTQFRYFFKVPATFTSGAYECGKGNHLSEVRVTGVGGPTYFMTFELCPGTPFEKALSI